MNDSQRHIVQWFPGHMAKTRRLLKESLSLVDAVAEVLDARIPLSSQNPELADIIGNKPKIVLLNKSDLADEKTNLKWVEHFKNLGVPALLINSLTGKGLNQFRKVAKEVCSEKILQNQKKGMHGKALRIMVVGIPNTGKSSFINKMSGRDKAKVEDRAGVTRQNQWFTVGGGIELLDTPGVLWPKFDDPNVGNRLAFTGGVKDQILDLELIAMRLLEVLAKDYPESLAERYRLKDLDGIESYDLLQMLGKNRGMLISGGEIDTERASIALLDEFRAGKLGKISLESP